MIAVSEFSRRELEELDPIFTQARNACNIRERNYQLSVVLRNHCDKMKIDMYEYLRFKARQEIELEKHNQEEPRLCIVCGNSLTGKQEKYCKPKCRTMFYENKKKENETK